MYRKLWTEIVTEKIRKQADHLAYWKLAESEMLYGYIGEIQFDDATNREGHAAKVYSMHYLEWISQEQQRIA